jgi:hypothetical protein
MVVAPIIAYPLPDVRHCLTTTPRLSTLLNAGVDSTSPCTDRFGIREAAAWLVG